MEEKTLQNYRAECPIPTRNWLYLKSNRGVVPSDTENGLHCSRDGKWRHDHSQDPREMLPWGQPFYVTKVTSRRSTQPHRCRCQREGQRSPQALATCTKTPVEWRQLQGVQLRKKASNEPGPLREMGAHDPLPLALRKCPVTRAASDQLF